MDTIIRTTSIVKINGAKDLRQYIDQQTGFIQQIREEFLKDIQQPNATIHALPNFLNNSDWKFRAELCQNAHRSFVKQLTELPQFSTFLQKEATFNEELSQLEHFRKMLVTNKQQKKTTIRKIQDIIKLVKETERQHEEPAVVRLSSPTFDFVTTMSGGSMDDNEYDDGIPLEAEDSDIVKALKAQIETTKQNHRTISRNLLQQVDSIAKALRHRIVEVKKSAEDHVGEIIHHAEKCRAFITKCFDYSVLLYCASAWWNQTQKDAMDDGYYHLEVETVDPEESKFNPNLAAPTEHHLRICVFRGYSIHPNDLVHVYDFDQDLARAIYTQETIGEAEQILRRFRTPGIVVATCDA
jgi:nicotinamide mononucleotide adenylyltransferase